MIRFLLKVLCLMALAYAAYAGLAYWRQRAMLFPGAGVALRSATAGWPAAAERVRITASFGDVHAVLLRAATGPSRAPAIIFTHGNYEFVDQLVPELAPVTALGVHVLLLEFPGYGGAPGMPSFDTLGEASAQAYDWLARRDDVDPARIIAMGRSVGGGPACELTRRRKVHALVLLSTFTSLDAFARSLWLPAFLVRDRFDNLARVREFSGPTLIVHGKYDEIIPYQHGRSLAESAAHATFVTQECGHNNCPHFDPAFIRLLGDFLAAPTP